MRPGNYDQDTLGLIRGNAARQLDQSRELSNMYSSGIAEEGQHLGDTIASIPGAFGQGMGMRQGYERHGAGMQQHGQGMQKGEREIKRLDQVNELGGMQSEEARRTMERAKRENDYMQQPGKGGKTREQEQWDLPQQQAAQNMQIGQRQIAGLDDDMAQRKVMRAAKGYEQAYRDPANITAMAEADGNARSLGLTPQQIVEARNEGKRLKAGADSTRDMLYQFSPQGAEASQQMATINENNRAIINAQSALARLKNANPGSQDADDASRDIIGILGKQGVNVHPDFASSPGRIGMGGIESRTEILEKAIQQLQKQTRDSASYLRTSGGAQMGSGAAGRLQGLEQAMPPDQNDFNGWSNQGGGGQGAGASAIDKVLSKQRSSPMAGR